MWCPMGELGTEGSGPVLMWQMGDWSRLPSAWASAMGVGAAASAWLTHPGLAMALELPANDLGITGRLDTTVTVGGSVRAQGRDDRLVGVVNGGSAFSINGDDGDLNFDKGDLTSLAASASHELDLNWRNFGAFGRVFYFYDAAVMDIDPQRTQFTDDAKDDSGRDFEVLDAYVTSDFDLGPMPSSLRLGKQVLNWGESTFIPNGINTINPVDVAKLRVAGAELRDALQGIWAIDADVGLTENLSLEGFYQLQWDRTEIEPLGTYFSTNDFISPGGKRVYLGFGLPPVTDDPPLPPGSNPPIGTSVPRAGDEEPSSIGQFGFALRYFSPLLNDTEFGLYYVRQHSRLPVLNARTGTPAGLAAGDYADSASYFADYPEDIDLIGASFNTTLGTTGLALQGEVSYRIDQPLQVDDTEILYAGLSPVNPAVFGQSQLGAFGFDEEIQGFKKKDVVQAQVTATQVFGPTFGADQLSVVGEVGLTWVPDLEPEDELRYEGPGTYTSGNPFFTNIGVQPVTTTDGFADAFSWGYRLLVRAEYLGAIGPINLVPEIGWLQDVGGTTPQPLGNFVQGRKAYTLSLGANYLNTLAAEVSFTSFFGGETFNLRKDRDFVSFSLSYFF
jgi:hypothetical protein